MIYYRTHAMRACYKQNVTTPHTIATIKANIVSTLTIVTLLALFAYAFITGIDKSIDNQDRMLCNSAQVSGNEEYLTKCQCYYATNNIECIQK
jgi:hypothetical protein